MKQFLLCTDLDRTLIPNGKQQESKQALELFRWLAGHEAILLAFVTGRHRVLVEQAISEYELPQPDFVIADVGSTIYRTGKSNWQVMEEWSELIDKDWHGLAHEDLYRQLSVYPMLKLQESEKQGRHKLSFYVSLDADSEKLLHEMDVRLKHADIKANLVWSIDPIAHTGLLDVLPASAGKLQAIHHLMQLNGFTLGNTVFAGDSGNDLDVLCSDIQAILVANSDEEVKEQARSHAAKDSLYIAKGGYLGMNGNYSAGILEGMAHYFPEIDARLRDKTGMVDKADV